MTTYTENIEKFLQSESDDKSPERRVFIERLIAQVGGEDIFLKNLKNMVALYLPDLSYINGLSDKADLQAFYRENIKSLGRHSGSFESSEYVCDLSVGTYQCKYGTHDEFKDNEITIDEVAKGLYDPDIKDNTCDPRLLVAARYVCRKAVFDFSVDYRRFLTDLEFSSLFAIEINKLLDTEKRGNPMSRDLALALIDVGTQGYKSIRHKILAIQCYGDNNTRQSIKSDVAMDFFEENKDLLLAFYAQQAKNNTKEKLGLVEGIASKTRLNIDSIANTIYQERPTDAASMIVYERVVCRMVEFAIERLAKHSEKITRLVNSAVYSKI